MPIFGNNAILISVMKQPGGCRYCGKVLAGLNDHERGHIEKAPNRCCGKGCYSKANLTRHRSVVYYISLSMTKPKQ